MKDSSRTLSAIKIILPDLQDALSGLGDDFLGSAPLCSRHSDYNVRQMESALVYLVAKNIQTIDKYGAASTKSYKQLLDALFRKEPPAEMNIINSLHRGFSAWKDMPENMRPVASAIARIEEKLKKVQPAEMLAEITRMTKNQRALDDLSSLQELLSDQYIEFMQKTSDNDACIQFAFNRQMLLDIISAWKECCNVREDNLSMLERTMNRKIDLSDKGILSRKDKGSNTTLKNMAAFHYGSKRIKKLSVARILSTSGHVMGILKDNIPVFIDSVQEDEEFFKLFTAGDDKPIQSFEQSRQATLNILHRLSDFFADVALRCNIIEAKAQAVGIGR